ncbi:MAG TPA: T9SS type A sorting domain-containing protein [Bacteroidia bacterium]
MLRLKFLVPGLLCSGLCAAQITITAADIANAGDTLRVSTLSTTQGINHTLTGPGYTWDFSSLQPDMQRFEKFDAPSAFPSPYNLLFNPANTSYGKVNYQNIGSVFPGFSIDADYDFFKETAVMLRQNGIGYVLNGIPVPMNYSMPDTIYEFPVEFGDTTSGDYKFSTPSFAAIPFYYGEVGHRESVVDGWGDLITPFGTFPSLRVRAVITATDSLYIDTLGFGVSIPRPPRFEYKWLAAGSKVPLLQVDATDAGGSEIVTGVFYRDSVRNVPQVGIQEIYTMSGFSVSPNPCSETAVINYSLNGYAKVKISISNTLGQVVSVISDEKLQAGKQALTIDVKSLGLESGIYFVTLESGNKRDVKRLVVGK